MRPKSTRRQFIEKSSVAVAAAVVSAPTLGAQAKKGVLVLIEAKAAPGKRAELQAFLLGNMHEIVAAEGNQSVRFHANNADPNVLLFVEYWDARASYEKYLAWRYQKGDHARMISMMDGEVNVRMFDILA
jgi:quinol monooxygenase YgiN